MNHLQTMKILLVDDDPIYLNLLGEVLTLCSHEVLRAPDGETAMGLLKKEPVDLVISDALMPKMNGLDFHSNVRSDESLKNIPFAWVSGHEEILNVLHLDDPKVDFKFNKLTPLPQLLYFLTQLDGAKHPEGQHPDQGEAPTEE
jgi:CheY-like chemotaxis protein